jgi:ubiquinone biosynthesis protein Coq4
VQTWPVSASFIQLSKCEEMLTSYRTCFCHRNRPRINSHTVDLEKLRQMPDGTLGRTYIKFLDSNVSYFELLNYLVCAYVQIAALNNAG